MVINQVLCLAKYTLCHFLKRIGNFSRFMPPANCDNSDILCSLHVILCEMSIIDYGVMFDACLIVQ